jgi:hypothetical protein
MRPKVPEVVGSAKTWHPWELLPRAGSAHGVAWERGPWSEQAQSWPVMLPGGSAELRRDGSVTGDPKARAVPWRAIIRQALGAWWGGRRVAQSVAWRAFAGGPSANDQAHEIERAILGRPLSASEWGAIRRAERELRGAERRLGQLKAATVKALKREQSRQLKAGKRPAGRTNAEKAGKARREMLTARANMARALRPLRAEMLRLRCRAALIGAQARASRMVDDAIARASAQGSRLVRSLAVSCAASSAKLDNATRQAVAELAADKATDRKRQAVAGAPRGARLTAEKRGELIDEQAGNIERSVCPVAADYFRAHSGHWLKAAAGKRAEPWELFTEWAAGEGATEITRWEESRAGAALPALVAAEQAEHRERIEDRSAEHVAAQVAAGVPVEEASPCADQDSECWEAKGITAADDSFDFGLAVQDAPPQRARRPMNTRIVQPMTQREIPGAWDGFALTATKRPEAERRQLAAERLERMRAAAKAKITQAKAARKTKAAERLEQIHTKRALREFSAENARAMSKRLLAPLAKLAERYHDSPQQSRRRMYGAIERASRSAVASIRDAAKSLESRAAALDMRGRLPRGPAFAAYQAMRHELDRAESIARRFPETVDADPEETAKTAAARATLEHARKADLKSALDAQAAAIKYAARIIGTKHSDPLFDDPQFGELSTGAAIERLERLLDLPRMGAEDRAKIGRYLETVRHLDKEIQRHTAARFARNRRKQEAAARLERMKAKRKR